MDKWKASGIGVYAPSTLYLMFKLELYTRTVSTVTLNKFLFSLLIRLYF